MPVLIRGGRGTATWSNDWRDPPRARVSCEYEGPIGDDGFFNPSFEKDTAGWQANAIGWDAATITRVFAVPLLFTATPLVGTNGVTPTSADAAPDAIGGVVVDGVGTVVCTTTNPLQGTLSYLCTPGGANRACLYKSGFAAYNHIFVRAYFNKDTAPSVNQTIIKGFQGSVVGNVAGLSVRVNSSSHLEVLNAANGVVGTAAALFVVGADFHVVLDVTLSTGAGSLTIYAGKDSDSPVVEVVPFTAGANAFSASIDTWAFGNCATNNAAGTVKFGGIAISLVNPGSYEVGENSANPVPAHDGKWVGKLTYPTGTATSGALYRIPAGTHAAGLKKMLKFWVYVPTGSPDVRARDYASGTLGPTTSVKDAWVELPLVITTLAGDQYVGVVDATANHTSGQYFYLDDLRTRLWPGLIANPSVEETLAGWGSTYSAWDTGTLTRDHAVLGHDGDWALKLAYPTPATAGACTNRSKTSASASDSIASASFTPAAGSMLIASWEAEWDGGAGAPTIADTFGGLTWTQIASVTDFDFSKFGVWWAIAPGTPVAGTVTVTAASAAGTRRHALTIDEVTGQRASSPVIQSVVNDTAFASTVPLALAAAPASSSLVVTGLMQESSTSPTTPSGFTTLANQSNGNITGGVNTAYKNGSVAQSNSWTGTQSNQTVGYAIEIALAAAGGLGYAGVSLVMPTEEDLKVGNSYTFGIWVYVPTGSPDVAAEIPGVATGSTVSTKNAWTLATVTGVCTSINQTLGVRNAVANSYGAGNVFYADDAGLTDLGVITPPATNTGAGFLSLL